MTVKQKHTAYDTLYFNTFTCYQWKSLIQLADVWNQVYEGFDEMKELYNVRLTGYCIMPNHIHSMLYVPEGAPDINTLLASQKRYLAYDIVDKLEEQRQYVLLNELQAAVSDYEKAKGQLHKVFKTSSDIKECYSEWFILQKLDYMHKNPVSGIWDLVEDYTCYPHSSAGFYERNKQGLYEVVHYQDVWGSYE